MINVIGLGYIGLPTALMFAKHGVKVVGTDYNQKLVTKLQKGELTFEEKGLDELFKNAIDKGITFSSEYQKTDTYIVAVPTPYMHLSKKLDPSYVIKAVNQILATCEPGAIIVIESTISPGSIDKYIRPEIEQLGFVIGKDIHLAHAPERIIPGNMIYELEHNSRTLGVDSLEVAEKIKKLYSSFCKEEIVITDIRSAEMSKVVENTFRDINIAFANELAKICRSDNMDVYEIIRIANKHPRVNILQPGCGVGGHCIAVDPYFIVSNYPMESKIIASAREVNNYKSFWCAEQVKTAKLEFQIKHGRKPSVAIMGLAFKPNIDDLRESPAKYIAQKVLQDAQDEQYYIVGA
jgi:UDP-N-acetyl-D-mannosaminuronic acid dehydrogenase